MIALQSNQGLTMSEGHSSGSQGGTESSSGAMEHDLDGGATIDTERMNKERDPL